MNELFLRHDLRLVKAAHPHIRLSLQPEGKASLDELHGFFERNIWSGRDQSVEMVRHLSACGESPVLKGHDFSRAANG